MTADRRPSPGTFGRLHLVTDPNLQFGGTDHSWIAAEDPARNFVCEKARRIFSYHKRLSFEVRSMESSFLVVTCWSGFHLTQSFLQTDPIHMYE